MYCVKCGVELSKGAEKCPLCLTKVYYPEPEEREALSYPAYRPDEPAGSAGVMTVLTALLLIPVVLCLAIDLKLHSGLVWGGYAAGGIVTAYLIFLLPLWFPGRNPVIFFPVDAAAVLLMLLYINLKTGGSWFLSFAFPVAGALAILIETMIVLLRYVVGEKRHRAAIILGGGAIALGAVCVLIELLIHVTFGFAMVWWSFIPFTVQLIVGVLAIVVGANAGLRESFYKKFFI